MCIQNKRPVLYIYSMAIYIIMGPVFCIYINMGPEFCIHINDMYSSIFMHVNLEALSALLNSVIIQRGSCLFSDFQSMIWPLTKFFSIHF